MTSRVKICCIGSIEEARIAIEYGASAIGLVSAMPSGPGVIPEKLIYSIARSVPPPIGTFLLTSETSAEKIITQHQATLTNTIQLVDRLAGDSYGQLRQAMPAIKFVHVIHITGEKSVEEAVEVSESVDALLLDSGNPNLQIKELGGTGRVHDWRLSRKICDSVQVPVFLAGGLHAGNIKRAFDEVQPFGLDICSGVRTNGSLDKNKLELLFQAIN